MHACKINLAMEIACYLHAHWKYGKFFLSLFLWMGTRGGRGSENLSATPRSREFEFLHGPKAALQESAAL
jgi:hypothetical protein